jgi:hypothetical protein
MIREHGIEPVSIDRPLQVGISSFLSLGLAFPEHDMRCHLRWHVLSAAKSKDRQVKPCKQRFTGSKQHGRWPDTSCPRGQPLACFTGADVVFLAIDDTHEVSEIVIAIRTFDHSATTRMPPKLASPDRLT